MRIVDKAQFVLGIFDIVVGVGLVIACILLNRTSKIACAFIPVMLGISALLRGIETTGQRKHKEKLVKAQARTLGWKDESDAEES